MTHMKTEKNREKVGGREEGGRKGGTPQHPVAPLRVRLWLMTHSERHLPERLQLLMRDQIELHNEVIEVFVAGIDVCFLEGGLATVETWRYQTWADTD